MVNLVSHLSQVSSNHFLVMSRTEEALFKVSRSPSTLLVPLLN